MNAESADPAVSARSADPTGNAATTLSIATLLRLQNWLSPAFPIGAYTCSHGLESAIADGRVSDAAALLEWTLDVLRHGSARNDAIVLRAAHAAVLHDEPDALGDLAELSLALSAGAERRRESVLLGASFRRAAAPSPPLTPPSGPSPPVASPPVASPPVASPPAPSSSTASPSTASPSIASSSTGSSSTGSSPTGSSSTGSPFTALPSTAPPPAADPLGSLHECPLPVAIGALSAAAGLPVLPVLAAALQSSAANLAWIATRLIPLGQSETLALLATLEPIVADLAERAAVSTLEDLGGCAVLADIDSLRHEQLRSRVCRT